MVSGQGQGFAQSRCRYSTCSHRWRLLVTYPPIAHPPTLRRLLHTQRLGACFVCSSSSQSLFSLFSHSKHKNGQGVITNVDQWQAWLGSLGVGGKHPNRKDRWFNSPTKQSHGTLVYWEVYHLVQVNYSRLDTNFHYCNTPLWYCCGLFHSIFTLLSSLCVFV